MIKTFATGVYEITSISVITTASDTTVESTHNLCGHYKKLLRAAQNN